MTEENTTAPSGVSRRTLVKGAAWSLPVIAVAAATPLASASTHTWNATVTAVCTNDYDLSLLESLVGDGLILDAAQTALGLLGFTPGATRGFRVTATTGDIPIGTRYLLTDPDALIEVGGLSSLVSAGVAGVASTAEGIVITTTAVITQGNSFDVDVYNAIADAGVASSFTLTQTTPDAVAGDNQATTGSLAAAAVDLSTLSGPLGNLGLSGSLIVQTCDL